MRREEPKKIPPKWGPVVKMVFLTLKLAASTANGQSSSNGSSLSLWTGNLLYMSSYLLSKNYWGQNEMKDRDTLVQNHDCTLRDLNDGGVGMEVGQRPVVSAWCHCDHHHHHHRLQYCHRHHHRVHQINDQKCHVHHVDHIFSPKDHPTVVDICKGALARKLLVVLYKPILPCKSSNTIWTN